MVKTGRREEFLETTMQIIAEKGLGGFSLKQVTAKLGVSEALLYKYFPSKENLLYSCFESVHKSIAALFYNFDLPPLETTEDHLRAVRKLWFTYFDFLVKGGYKTIFYFDYRDSPYIKNIEVHDDEARETYFKSFALIMHVLNTQIKFTEKVNSDHLWTYVLDTSGIFAKRIIRGELADDAQSYEEVWRLISGGFLSLFMP